MICTSGSLRGYLREECPISSGNYLLPLTIGGADMAKQKKCRLNIIYVGSLGRFNTIFYNLPSLRELAEELLARLAQEGYKRTGRLEKIYFYR